MQKLSVILLGLCLFACKTPEVQNPAPESSLPAEVAPASQSPCALKEGDPVDACGPIPLTDEMTAPKKIASKCSPPEYPRGSRRGGEQGKVKMQVVIDREGNATNILVLDGPKNFHEAAAQYIQKCKYSPAMLNAQPVSVYKTEVVSFTLK